jgi:hypothetical protein
MIIEKFFLPISFARLSHHDVKKENEVSAIFLIDSSVGTCFASHE